MYIVYIKERHLFSLVCTIHLERLLRKINVPNGALRFRDFFHNECVSFIQFTFSSSMTTLFILFGVYIWILSSRNWRFLESSRAPLSLLFGWWRSVLLSLFVWCNYWVTCHRWRNFQWLSHWKVKMDFISNKDLFNSRFLSCICSRCMNTNTWGHFLACRYCIHFLFSL